MKKLIVFVAASVLAISATYADWWQDGNLVVLRVGDGVSTLANTGNPIFLDQFTTAGGLYGTLGIPNSGATAMLQSGSASSEGFLSSYNKTLVFMGYNTPGTGASLPGTSKRLTSPTSAHGGFCILTSFAIRTTQRLGTGSSITSVSSVLTGLYV